MVQRPRVVGEGLGIYGLLLALSLAGVLGARRTHLLGGGTGGQHPGSPLEHRVHGLSVEVGGQGLDHLTVLQVGLGVRRGHQGGSRRRGCS